MKIFYKLEELEGTCYIEILPGRYKGNCWNKESIFFEEETFGYLESVFEMEFSKYDHFAFNEIPKKVWEKILIKFDSIIEVLECNPKQEDLKDRIDFIFQSSESDFIQHFEENCKRLSKLIREFKEWIRTQLRNYEVISVLGI